MKILGFDLNADPGNENLNLRAYFASVVGPFRVANGQRQVKTVPVVGDGRSGKTLVRNGGKQGKACVYVEVWLPNSALQQLPAGVQVGFGGNGDGLTETADRVLLANFPGAPNTKYRTVLLPQETLYAVILGTGDGSPLPDNLASQVPLVAAQVTV